MRFPNHKLFKRQFIKVILRHAFSERKTVSFYSPESNKLHNVISHFNVHCNNYCLGYMFKNIPNIVLRKELHEYLKT